MRLSVQIATTALVAAVVAGGWIWVGGANDVAASKSRKGRTAPVPVLTESTVFADDAVQIRAIGTAKAARSATLHPSVTGEVVAVLFSAGQRVNRGDALVRLDDAHQRLAVQLARVTVKEVQRQVDRLERLTPSGATSVAGLLTAQSELESAILNQARAKEALADRSIVAPFSGVIGLTSVEPGDRVDEKTPIATLDDRSSIRVQFNVPEDYAGLVNLGDSVIVQPRALGSAGLQGTVSALDSRLHEVTRSLRVEATIANREDMIRPGTSFEVLQKFAGGSYPIIREVAVLWSRDGAYVWRDSAGKAEKVFVRVVRRAKGQILVDGPLNVGDSIVVEGVQGLRIGQPIAARPFTKTGG
jgi:membrane fusion protein (multidrug efflux system)